LFSAHAGGKIKYTLQTTLLHPHIPGTSANSVFNSWF